MSDSNIVDLNGALEELMRQVHQTIQVVGNNSMENDKALLRLGTVMSERILDLEQRVFHLESKVEILHELYHTHFADSTDDGEETKH